MDRVTVNLGHPLSGNTGYIASIPNPVVAWVKIDNKEHEYGVKMSELTKQSPALKHDQDKVDLSHITLELVELVARVRMFGAKKYSRGNWKKGFKVTRSLAAALRHIFTFLSGETNDPESGLSHLGHAVCCIEHAIYDMKHHPENDDREVL